MNASLICKEVRLANSTNNQDSVVLKTGDETTYQPFNNTSTKSYRSAFEYCKKETIYLGPWIGRQTIIITTQKRSMLILSRAAKDLNGIFNNFQEDTSAFGTSGFRVSKIF